jgi:hypothetical protein
MHESIKNQNQLYQMESLDEGTGKQFVTHPSDGCYSSDRRSGVVDVVAGEQNSVVPVARIREVCARVYSRLVPAERVQQRLSLSILVDFRGERGL